MAIFLCVSPGDLPVFALCETHHWPRSWRAASFFLRQREGRGLSGESRTGPCVDMNRAQPDTHPHAWIPAKEKSPTQAGLYPNKWGRSHPPCGGPWARTHAQPRGGSPEHQHLLRVPPCPIFPKMRGHNWGHIKNTEFDKPFIGACLGRLLDSLSHPTFCSFQCEGCARVRRDQDCSGGVRPADPPDSRCCQSRPLSGAMHNPRPCDVFFC